MSLGPESPSNKALNGLNENTQNNENKNIIVVKPFINQDAANTNMDINPNNNNNNIGLIEDIPVTKKDSNKSDIPLNRKAVYPKLNHEEQNSEPNYVGAGGTKNSDDEENDNDEDIEEVKEVKHKKKYKNDRVKTPEVHESNDGTDNNERSENEDNSQNDNSNNSDDKNNSNVSDDKKDVSQSISDIILSSSESDRKPKDKSKSKSKSKKHKESEGSEATIIDDKPKIKNSS